MSGTVRIAMWSGPRALSTAMMRAWENRPDCIVVDEPLYGAFLQASGIDHPMSAEIIAAMECDPQVVGEAMATASGAPIVYQKHMTHHLLSETPRDWIGKLTNAFLIRDPAYVLASYEEKRAAPDLFDIGIAQQADLFDRLCDQTGRAPPVIDADDLQREPEAMLQSLCAALEVPFSERMLSWPAGPRDSDGVWAAHWYDSVWRSTGFAPPGGKRRELPDSLKSVYAQAQPLYEHLARHRLRPAD